MTEKTETSAQKWPAVPPDDPDRELSVVDPDDPSLRHVAVVGDAYTILLSGAQTAGRYCLIDMSVPHCGGPGPHRPLEGGEHDDMAYYRMFDRPRPRLGAGIVSLIGRVSV